MNILNNAQQKINCIFYSQIICLIMSYINPVLCSLSAFPQKLKVQNSKFKVTSSPPEILNQILLFKVLFLQ